MTGGWDTEKPFAGASPPQNDLPWAEWDSRTQFIIPLLEALRSSASVICVSIAGLKGLGKSSIVDFARYVFERQNLLQIDDSETDDLPTPIAPEVSQIRDRVRVEHCSFEDTTGNNEFDFRRIVPRLRKIWNSKAEENAYKTVLVVETEHYECLQAIWRSGRVALSPIQIDPVQKRRVTQSVTADSTSISSVPVLEVEFIPQNSGEEDIGYELKEATIREGTFSCHVRIIHYKKPVRPLRKQEIREWIRGESGSIEIKKGERYWRSSDHHEHCCNSDQGLHQAIESWAGRHPTLLAIATTALCPNCQEGGPPCGLVQLQGVKKDEIDRILKRLKEQIENTPEQFAYLLGQYGLLDDQSRLAEVVPGRLLGPICKRLQEILQDDYTFSTENRQNYWISFREEDDPTWGELLQRCTQNGNLRIGSTDELVRMCVRNHKLTNLVDRMRMDRPAEMEGWPINLGER